MTLKLIAISCLLFLGSCTKNIVPPDESCDPCEDYDPPPPPPPVNPNVQSLTFRGIRPDDPGGRNPIENPERGFRFEFIMKASTLTNPYHGTNYASGFSTIVQNEDNNYGSPKMKLAQVYFYLTDYLSGNITSNGFANMQYIFDQLKLSGVKVVLRFAYKYGDASSANETLGDISNHLAALKAFLQQNESMIYVVQAGFLGQWGEWHNSAYNGNLVAQGLIIREILKNIPPNKKLQVRETDYKTNAVLARSGSVNYNGSGTQSYSYPGLTTSEQNRIGFHNDYFVLDQGAHANEDYRWPDNDFYKAKAEGPYTVVDGEMPYDILNDPWSFNTVAYGSEGGWYGARRMRAHGYTSFSIVHNYNTNINAWKSHLLRPYQFQNDGTLVTDEYFSNQSGSEVPRTAFEYIRDHLGYRLQLRTGNIPVSTPRGGTAHIEVAVKNFGFSRMINSRPIYFVLIDPSNNVKEYLTSVNGQDIYPTFGQYDGIYQIAKDIAIDNTFAPGQYKVGIWMPDASTNLKYNPLYSVRLANGNMTWWSNATNQYLVNIIGTFQVN